MKKITLLFLFLLVLAWEGKGQVIHCRFPDYVDGENLRRAGMYQKALNEFAKSIKREPTNFKYFYAISMTFFEMKNYDSALAVANKTIALNPQFLSAYLLKSKIFGLKSQLDSAVAMIEKAVELAPDDVSLMETAGKLLCKANKLNEGIVYLEMVVAQNPKNYECYNYLAIAHKRNGNMDKALEYRSLYLRAMPKKKALPAGG